jgi:hypothetical protein
MSDAESPPVVSDRLTVLILSSPRLRQLLLPGGLIRSPYKILDYQGTLILRDKTGATAVARREQRIKFQQDGVSAILDHFWGPGIQLAEYTTTAGTLRDSLRDQGRRHLVVQLQRAMARGEVLDFEVERTIRDVFSDREGWVETMIDHPIAKLSQTVIFPRDRPCQSAELVYGGETVPLHVMTTPEGSTQLAIRIGQPQRNTPYLIRWSW